MSSSLKSSRSSDVIRKRRCPGTATWRNSARARAVLIVDLNGEKILGPRFIRLLEEIRARGSVRRAAFALGIGYRHAIAWIRRAEEMLEQPLVTRHAGGVAGGGAGLTVDAITLIRRYRQIGRELARIVERAEQLILGSRS